MSLESYQTEEPNINKNKTDNQQNEDLDNFNNQENISEGFENTQRQIDEIENQINTINIDEISDDTLKKEIEDEINKIKEALENNDKTTEQLHEIQIKINEIIQRTRNENEEIINTLNSNDTSSETAQKYGEILSYFITIKDLPSEELEKKIAKKNKELNIDINELLEKNDEEKILTINELSKNYSQEAIYEMANLIGLPGCLAEIDDNENKIFYIESTKGCIVINQGKMQYYGTPQEAIIQSITGNIVEKKSENNMINFNGKGSVKIFENEVRDDYNEDGELKKTSLTNKNEKKSYKMTCKIKLPFKGMSISGYAKGNRYTGTKIIEENGSSSIKNNNGGNVYIGGNISYKKQVTNNTEMTITSTIEKNITKDEAQIQYSFESGLEFLNGKYYVGAFAEKDKYNDKSIGLTAEYNPTEQISISGNIGYTYGNDKRDEKTGEIRNNQLYNGVFYGANIGYEVNQNIHVSFGYNNVNGLNTTIIWKI